MDFDRSVYCFLTQADYTNLFRSLDLYQTIYFDQLIDCPMTNSGILSRGSLTQPMWITKYCKLATMQTIEILC